MNTSSFADIMSQQTAESDIMTNGSSESRGCMSDEELAFGPSLKKSRIRSQKPGLKLISDHIKGIYDDSNESEYGEILELCVKAERELDEE